MLEQADVRFMIPMAGMVQSFNVSVAAAITLYHATSILAPIRRPTLQPVQVCMLCMTVVVYVPHGSHCAERRRSV